MSEAAREAERVRALLRRVFSDDSDAVAPIGAGAWSRCFAFASGGRALVVRLGDHVEDFEKDARAHAYAGPALPVPRQLAIGRADQGGARPSYYAVAERAYGEPIELLGAAGWLAVVPSLADALEAMRAADIAGSAGYGGWGADGRGAHPSWAAHLLSVAEDTPDRRTYGWRAALEDRAPAGAEAFRWGYGLLERLAHTPAPRSLIHADLTNRNVLAEGGRITAVLDWGCSIYGDHLYDLALAEFWSPWQPELSVAALRDELGRRWAAAGYAPQRLAERMAACHLHIGLDHIAYNAFQRRWADLDATAARMRELVAALV